MAAQLRFRALFAGTAIAALALTGCVQSADDDEGGSEESSSEGSESSAPESSAASESSSESSSSSSPSEESSAGESASSESSSSSSAAPGEAPEDLDDGDLTSALSTQINGTQLMAVTPDQLGAAGMDIEEELSAEFGDGFEVTPATCEDPFMGAMLGGMNDTDDSVIAVDSEGSLILTARAYDDADAAEEALEEQRDALDDCGDVEVTVDGTASEAGLSSSDLEVEGAASAYESEVEVEGETIVTGSMAYGNTVVNLVDVAQFEGGSPAPDNAALLEETATALSEG